MTTAHLLQPLTEGGACGISLLYEPEYDAIGAVRQEDAPTLPQGAWATTLKRADWKEAARLCEKALAERSKDLQVAAWLGEAWIANDGLAGGLRATQLVQGLCDAFWEGLHPLPRNGDIEFRTAPFDWADEHWSMSLVLRAPLVRGTGADARTVTLAQWREVMAQENDERKNRKPPSDSEKTGVLTRDCVMTQLATMPMSECVAALDAARAWTAAVDELHAALDRHLREAAPRLRKLRNTLTDSEDVLRQCVEQHPDFVEQRAPEPEVE